MLTIKALTLTFHVVVGLYLNISPMFTLTVRVVVGLYLNISPMIILLSLFGPNKAKLERQS